MSLACGIDVGGTKIAGGVVDDSGTIVEQLRVESPAQDAEAIEQAIAGLVRQLAERHDFTAVGVGAPGYVAADRARVLFAPNVAWVDVDVKGDLEEQLDTTVVVENDANAAAWGEFRFGAGHDVDDLLLVTVGTGVGGGFVLDGELYRGAYGVGAEIGHLRVVPDGILCGCGHHGCFEQYASGTRAGARGPPDRGERRPRRGRPGGARGWRRREDRRPHDHRGCARRRRLRHRSAGRARPLAGGGHRVPRRRSSTPPWSRSAAA